VNFKDATDELIGRVTLPEIAAACGASVNAVERARMDPKGSSYRNAPPGWEIAVARLARERGGDLLRLADALEAGASGRMDIK
jgi:hypothetical protein